MTGLRADIPKHIKKTAGTQWAGLATERSILN
jgi:hypothetical protein